MKEAREKAKELIEQSMRRFNVDKAKAVSISEFVAVETMKTLNKLPQSFEVKKELDFWENVELAVLNTEF